MTESFTDISFLFLARCYLVENNNTLSTTRVRLVLYVKNNVKSLN